jgi:hypothetical protein
VHAAVKAAAALPLEALVRGSSSIVIVCRFDFAPLRPSATVLLDDRRNPQETPFPLSAMTRVFVVAVGLTVLAALVTARVTARDQCGQFCGDTRTCSSPYCNCTGTGYALYCTAGPAPPVPPAPVGPTGQCGQFCGDTRTCQNSNCQCTGTGYNMYCTARPAGKK